MTDQTRTTMKTTVSSFAAKARSNFTAYDWWNLAVNIIGAFCSLGTVLCAVFVAATPAPSPALTIANALFAAITTFFSGAAFLGYFDLQAKRRRWFAKLGELEYLTFHLDGSRAISEAQFTERLYAINKFDPERQTETDLAAAVAATPFP